MELQAVAAYQNVALSLLNLVRGRKPRLNIVELPQSMKNYQFWRLSKIAKFRFFDGFGPSASRATRFHAFLGLTEPSGAWSFHFCAIMRWALRARCRRRPHVKISLTSIWQIEVVAEAKRRVPRERASKITRFHQK